MSSPQEQSRHTPAFHSSRPGSEARRRKRRKESWSSASSSDHAPAKRAPRICSARALPSMLFCVTSSGRISDVRRGSAAKSPSEGGSGAFSKAALPSCNRACQNAA
eukprot:3941823-Rhodomonas_salina.1